MIKAIVFDFDGVILESLNLKAEAFKELYKEYGSKVSKKVEKHHLENGGISRHEKIKHYHNNFLNLSIDDKEINKNANDFSKIVKNKILKVPFVDGAENFLVNNYNNYLMFISSATPFDELKYICKNRSIENYFKGILGAPSSKEEHVKKIMNKWSLSNEEIVFIGDSISDYKASLFHNLFFIARITEQNIFPSNQKYKLFDLTKLEQTIKRINKVKN